MFTSLSYQGCNYFLLCSTLVSQLNQLVLCFNHLYKSIKKIFEVQKELLAVEGLFSKKKKKMMFARKTILFEILWVLFLCSIHCLASTNYHFTVSTGILLIICLIWKCGLSNQLTEMTDFFN